jgi:hypothetical protein
LELLVCEYQFANKELETSKVFLKNKTMRAIKGEDLFQDVKLNHWKVEVDIVKVKRDLTNLNLPTKTNHPI